MVWIVEAMHAHQPMAHHRRARVLHRQAHSYQRLPIIIIIINYSISDSIIRISSMLHRIIIYPISDHQCHSSAAAVTNIWSICLSVQLISSKRVLIVIFINYNNIINTSADLDIIQLTTMILFETSLRYRIISTSCL